MGKLALWGAVAGGAKGYQKELANREKREAADLDEARQARFAKMKMEHDEKLAGRSEEHDKNMAGLKSDYTIAEIGARGEVQQAVDQSRIGATTESQLGVQDDRQEFDAEQNKLDRESREKIAKIARSPNASAAAKRFQAKTLTVTEAQAKGMPIEQDTPAVFDTKAGKWYVQQGSMLLYPGDEEPERPAPSQAIDALYKNPGHLSAFYDKYGYAPTDMLEILNAAGTPAP